MAGEDLVVEADTGSLTDFHGISAVTDVAGLIKSDSWAEGGIDAASVGLDVVGLMVDPIGTLVSWGMAWVIEHFGPLKRWLDDLAGSPSEVTAFAGTWQNISTSLSQAADDIERDARNDLAEIEGETQDAYQAFVRDNVVPTARALSQSAAAVQASLERASGIVKIVHDLVRDIISTIVGSLASAALEEAATLGLGTPAVVTQVTEKVASWTARLQPLVGKLIRIIGKLKELHNKLGDRLGELVTDKLTKNLAEFHVDYVPSYAKHLAVPDGLGGGTWKANISEKFLYGTAGRTVGNTSTTLGLDVAPRTVLQVPGLPSGPGPDVTAEVDGAGRPEKTSDEA